MKMTESFSLALKNIASSKMRTFLTMLGIIIGITAVIVIVGLGNGMQRYMEDSFAELGTNTLSVMISGRGSSSRSVSVDDMYKIVEENHEYLDQLSPNVTMSGTVKVGTETYSATAVSGVSEDYFSMKGYTVAQGRGIQYVDVSERKHICVVGSYVADTYYGGSAVGQTIKVGANKFTIVGVLAQQADEADEGGTDDAVYVPYSTASRLSGVGTISSYTITVVNEDQSAAAKKVVENALFDVFDDSDAYAVISMSEILDMMNSMIDVMITILTVIAAISLVVGGIGIMNIMLVSVTERTREIGIRKALGAKERYIMQQFVIEAATTSSLGGVIGILLGYAMSSVATVLIVQLTGEAMTVVPTADSILVAVGVSMAIGIAFGYLPAKKAARLNPIDALHYE
ncbi:ABC transporter permease [Oscillibacter sp. MSJ-2]|uniref:ABC transporter permease n=1 Tax=Dysosmobacter acutus TaxID=2841504 RepID=A0ABS6F843_9FIRM|nr:ABC transporter permease [Dysosmobacter acutus]MBU5626446.1 ABC transporter permease [Dysosmobacter acutus]